ncbi:MAG: hypothetical protein H7323_08365 [Frankiales bacterium]|nr:hypothetical protein [Frankiales bacterium]
MTESPFPFGAVEQAPGFGDEPAGDSRRNVIVLGGLAALLLGGGAYFLLGGGSDTADEFAFTPAVPRAAAKAVPSPQAVKLPVATKVAIGRNPFKALYVQPVVAAAAPSTTTQTTSTTPVSTAPVGTPIVVVSNGSAPAPATPPSRGFGGSAPAPAPAPATSPPASPAPAPSPARAQSTVKLTGVSTKDGVVGNFVYDDVKLSGKVGDVMGGRLMLISLQQDATGKWFANLQLGDGAPFEVFEGQTVVVQ